MIPRELISEPERGWRVALLLFVGLAIASPAIPLPDGLPAVRAEQIWLALLLFPLSLHYRRHPRLLLPSPLDLAFLALGLAVAATLLIAPMTVTGVGRSLRDLFEPARVIEYWLAFRLALLARPGAVTTRDVVALLAAAAAVSGAVALVQYLDPGTFNATFTDIWANAHNLEAVVKRGRAVGLVGNPNYFGMLSGLLLSLLLARRALLPALESRSAARRHERWLLPAGMAAATAALLLSQSRTATFATAGALGVGLLWTLLLHRRRASYLAPIATVVLAAAVTVAIAELFPPDYGGLRQRFQIQSLAQDSSLSLRVTRWRNFVESLFRGPPDICGGEELDGAIVAGHEPPAETTRPTPAVAARDARRVDDIRLLSTALLNYFCDKDRWPADDPEAALVPEYLPEMPRDPASGQPYELYVIPGGFVASARLEDEAAPAGPTFALGTMPNLVRNSSFEVGRSTPSGWATVGLADGRAETSLALTGEARFGERAVRADIGGSSAFYQRVVWDFTPGQDYTVNLWARATGDEERVQIYLVGTAADGSVVDPLARSGPIAIRRDRWGTSSFTFRTPADQQIVAISVFIRSLADDDPVEAIFDAVSLTPGPIVPSYPWLRDATPAEARTLPGFADSPLIGVGPLKEFELGALDNEYALFLDRYGILGFSSYLLLFGIALLVAVRASLAPGPAEAALGLGLGTGIVALMVFSIAAGAFYNFQLMAVFWPLVGLAAAAGEEPGRKGEGGD